MRILMNVVFPEEPFNAFVRDGSIAHKIGKILESVKPEAAYFTEYDGHRGAMIVVDVPSASSIPALAEPWFLSLNATCSMRIAMTPDDLQKSDLADAGKKW
jgi:hypothetical protein